jgi:hypothetical protein
MYVISYFTEADEALHLAVSRDGEQFAPLNDGRPVLRGTVGTRALRDPFIGVGPGGVFHLLATDGWTSPSIVHATSTDLLTWTDQELLPVMAGIDGAHNAWAPEFFLDESRDTYYLIWSSVVEAGTTASGRDWQNTGQNHRIWHCTTEDFRSFSPASVFFDPGYSVIDATVEAVTGGGFLMAFKDERGTNDLTTRHKDVFITTFDTAGGPYRDPVGPVTPSVAEGPSLYRRGEEWVLIFDHYLEGRYGAVSSMDGLAWRPVSLSLPAGMRHASVLKIPQGFRTHELAIGSLT